MFLFESSTIKRLRLRRIHLSDFPNILAALVLETYISCILIRCKGGMSVVNFIYRSRMFSFKNSEYLYLKSHSGRTKYAHESNFTAINFLNSSILLPLLLFIGSSFNMSIIPINSWFSFLYRNDFAI